MPAEICLCEIMGNVNVTEWWAADRLSVYVVSSEQTDYIIASPMKGYVGMKVNVNERYVNTTKAWTLQPSYELRNKQ